MKIKAPVDKKVAKKSTYMNKNPSPEHQKLVLALVNAFKDMNFSILKAAHEGFDEPKKHGRHEPDIVALDKSGTLHLAEAKVGDDLYSSTTEEQFIDFSDRVMTGTKTQVPFHIIVYKNEEENLNQVLSKLGLDTSVGSRITTWVL